MTDSNINSLDWLCLYGPIPIVEERSSGRYFLKRQLVVFMNRATEEKKGFFFLPPSQISSACVHIMPPDPPGSYSPAGVFHILQECKGQAFPQYSPVEAAAARATARFNMRCDGHHALTRESGGMHSNYLSVLHDRERQQFISDSENDLWDAVCSTFSKNTCTNS